MCDPVTLGVASFAVGAAQTVVGYMGQQAQFKAQQQAYAENVRSARESAMRTYESQQRRIMQEAAKASQEKTDAAIEAAQARSTAETAAATAGVSGLSVDSLIADYYGKEARNAGVIDTNYEATRNYLVDSMQETRATAQNQINSMPRPTPPSFLDAGIRVAGNALNAFSVYNRYNTALKS